MVFDTALSIVIADAATTGADTTNVVGVAPGDLVYWRVTPVSTPTVSEQRVSVEFWGTVVGESGYGGLSTLNDTLTYRSPLFAASGWNSGSGTIINFSIAAAAGSVAAVAYNLDQAPGVGTSYLLAISKNGTIQDGSGGTPDTRVTIANAATTGSWTGTLTVAAGDWLYLESVPTGTPTTARIGTGIKFVATTDGESHGGTMTYQNLPTSGTEFTDPNQFFISSPGWNATETDCEAAHNSVTPFVIRAMRVRIGTTITTGPVSFTLRQNNADTALSISLTSGNQTGSDLVDSITISPGNTWATEFTATGTPGVARIAAVGFVQFVQYTATLADSFALGYRGSIVGVARAGIISLDGNTNTNTEMGKLKLCGDLNVVGIVEIVDGSAAPVAQAGKAKFFVDVADGDLKIIFADGTVKLIVTDT